MKVIVKRSKRSQARLALAIGAVILLAALISAVSVSPARGGAVTRPVPLLRIAARGTTLSFPPDTDWCVEQLGIRCYQPAQLQKAYDLAPLFAGGVTGKGETIVIVDSFGSPTIKSDLATFDQTFGLPDPPSLRVYQPAGAVPAFDPTNDDMVGWAEETTLDVEWSHVMAPGANIVLLETPVSETEGVQGFPEIVKAENWALNHNIGDVISMSFGATEQTFPSKASILGLRSAFINAHARHVAVVSSSGDAGSTDYELNLNDLYPYQVTSWPTSDPLVTSIGGTQLTLDENGNRLQPDVVWNDGYGAGGGGLSTVFRRPAFQAGLGAVVDHRRGVPDISMSAAVDGGVVVYYTFANAGYHIFGGTSESAPEFAGIVALADQYGGRRINDLNAKLYELDYRHGLVDVTVGDNYIGPFTNSDGVTYDVPGFSAGPGYDLASGLGTIDGALFVPALAGRPKAPRMPVLLPYSGRAQRHVMRQIGLLHAPPRR
ncbi:MAG: S53 family peptidase [Gaiellaceae bacterium]